MWKLLVASLVSVSLFACGPLDESDLTATAESEARDGGHRQRPR